MINRVLGFLLLLFISGCGGQVEKETQIHDNQVELSDQDWYRDATIYELNTRQFSAEGTFRAVLPHIPRLKKLGIKIVWFMPVQPIGVLNRKGKLGSYYSIRDYTALNPEFGNAKDFRVVVNAFHEAGIKVILDWVANHTAWDHVWTKNKDWYTLDEAGNFVSPVPDWSDVIDLNYDNTAMRKAMIESMKYWVETYDIDGFRCDVAGMVPLDFWQSARKALDTVKPVFMLAEAEGPEFHTHGFDMTYAWEFHHIMNQMAQGKMTVKDLIDYYKRDTAKYSPNDFRMSFTTNHDENSWNGTVKERLGDAAETYFVLAATFGNCMPLIYSGQEMGLNHRLSFFGKDTIRRTNPELEIFYTQTLTLKHLNPALWNGFYGGTMHFIETDNENVLAYIRQKGDNKVIVFLNFSKDPVSFHYDSPVALDGYYQNGFRPDEFEGFPTGGGMTLQPFEYFVLVENQLKN